MTLTDADKAVLGWLEGSGSSLVSIRQIARDTRLSRIAVRTSLNVLADRDVICQAVHAGDPGSDTLHIVHIHLDQAGDDASGDSHCCLSCLYGTKRDVRP